MLTFGGDESLGAEFVSIRIAENNASERGAATAVVDDLLDDATDVPISLGVIERPQAGGVFVEPSMGFELLDVTRQGGWRTPRNNCGSEVD